MVFHDVTVGPSFSNHHQKPQSFLISLLFTKPLLINLKAIESRRPRQPSKPSET
ncbi:hypothetical protein CCACVL1_05436 [Corchorus capsularis]|uniref:Uncharacterized protein n=1 Tax=Corchorus capsularis TaxID=210143 RepID=A0A1R3JKI8_COCAP|nr:hypothetical protein CCACVL1_05436 [Corchorus capsularis]